MSIETLCSGCYYYSHSADEITEQLEIRRRAQGPSVVKWQSQVVRPVEPEVEWGRQAGARTASSPGPCRGAAAPEPQTFHFFQEELEIHNRM